MANEITLTQGDKFTLPFHLKDSPGAFHDLTGATMSLIVTALDGSSVTFDNTHFTLNDQTTDRGGGSVVVPTTETLTIGVGELKEILIRASQNAGADVFTWRAPRALQVLPARPCDGA